MLTWRPAAALRPPRCCCCCWGRAGQRQTLTAAAGAAGPAAAAAGGACVGGKAASDSYDGCARGRGEAGAAAAAAAALPALLPAGNALLGRSTQLLPHCGSGQDRHASFPASASLTHFLFFNVGKIWSNQCPPLPPVQNNKTDGRQQGISPAPLPPSSAENESKNESESESESGVLPLILSAMAES